MNRIALAALFAGGAFATLAFTVRPAPVLPPSARMAPTDTVWIEIVADGDSIKAVPDPATVAPDQEVQWTSALGNWEVKFNSKVPFGDDGANGIKGDKNQKKGKKVEKNAAKGSYKYDIKVHLDGGGNLKADPEIIVDPGEGDRQE